MAVIGANPDKAFTDNAVSLGWIKQDQLDKCLETQHRTVGRRMKRLGEIALELGFVDPDQLKDILAGKRKPKPAHKIGGYEIRGILGEGGLGTVYRGHQVSMKRDVALKVLRSKWLDDDEFRQRFLLEAREVGKMSHQNLIQVFEFGEDDEQLYFSMEYVEGKNVQQIIDEVGMMPLDQAIDILVQMLRAINYYKDRDVVHRDIKPSNIFLNPAGVAKLGDFGFIKTEIDKEISMEGYILGTPDYISPEQAMGEDDIDFRSDVYSLGASFYHMVTGNTPFLGSESAVIRQHLKLDVPSPLSFRADLPDDLVAILERMMAKRPEDRPRDLGQLMDELSLVKLGRSANVSRLEEGKSSILRGIDMTQKRLARLEEDRRTLKLKVGELRSVNQKMRAAMILLAIVMIALVAVIVSQLTGG